MIMKNRSRKETARALAEKEEAKKTKIIPFWKKSYVERIQQLQELQKLEEVVEPVEVEEMSVSTENHTEVKTDDEIEEELDNYDVTPGRALRRKSSEYSDIPEEVSEESNIDIEEELHNTEFENNSNMRTVNLHIDYEKGVSKSQVVDLLKNQWHSNFTDYSIEKIKNGQEFDVYSVSLKVPKTILPEHYFVYKGRTLSDSRFRNLVLKQQ
jgi:hypothetical protein